MSPSERRFPYLHARQAALEAENNRLRECIRNGKWGTEGQELASIQATIADNNAELDELDRVLAPKIPLPVNLALAIALLAVLIAVILLRV